MNYKDGVVITQGDDSNALNNDIRIILETELELEGYTAILQIGKLQWKFTDLTTKVISVIIDKEESLLLPPGTHYAALKIFDPDGLCKTILRDVPVFVKKMAVLNPKVVPSESSTSQENPENN